MPGDEPFELDVRDSKQRIIGLEHYKREIEQCLNPTNCKHCNGQDCRVVGHEVRHISGEPAIAVSQFSDGIRMRLDAYNSTLQPIANWGITVLPTDRGHSAVLHYFPQEHDIMNGTTENVRALNGRRLQEYLSSLILDNCENIAISPTIWDAFGAKKQQAIRERFIPELPALSYGPPERLAELEYRRLTRDRAIPNPKLKPR